MTALQNRRAVGWALVAALAVLVGVGLWRTSGSRARDRVAVVRHSIGVMGTDASLVAVVPAGRMDRAERCLREAEARLRSVEARMSTWIETTEVSTLGAAAAGQVVPLSPETVDVLRAARAAHAATDGAFDVTCRPLVALWRRAAERGKAPNEAELADARDASRWPLIELTDGGAVKHRASAEVDLGGIAKGYAVDRAAAVIRAAGAEGGMVDVGGDLACFGRPASGRTWSVDVKHPFAPGKLATLALAEGAVCTSGDYARFVEIAGTRYSHILDPRSGRPAGSVVAVTVVARTAMTADVWATALSVLGPAGLDRLPHGTEAMLVTGTKPDHRVLCTPGFHALIQPPRPERIELVTETEATATDGPIRIAGTDRAISERDPCLPFPTPATPFRRPSS